MAPPQFSSLLSTLGKGNFPDTHQLVQYIDACAPLSDDVATQERAFVLREELFAHARSLAENSFGKKVYIRGLIEFTNICQQDCLYCGIRKSNGQAARYRMSHDDVMECCASGHGLGFHTFVLQGGEDPWFTDAVMENLLLDIKASWPECAVTLSIGERSVESYARLRRAGADRFLLRHESANPEHFARLHPVGQTFASRKACLWNLKREGYQVGAGLMVGSPWQTTEHLANDLAFMYELQPEMAGIGPFLPHHDTPFAGFPPGDVNRSLVMLALTRIMLPRCLLPSTTALGSAADDGRERGILAGANVLMPNLSPKGNRKKYMLYDGKVSDGEEAAENKEALARRIAAIGYEVVVGRGDYVPARPLHPLS